MNPRERNLQSMPACAVKKLQIRSRDQAADLLCENCQKSLLLDEDVGMGTLLGFFIDCE